MKKLFVALAAIGLATTSVPAAANGSRDTAVTEAQPDPGHFPLWWSFVYWFGAKMDQVSALRGF